jgi:flagellar biosynthesis protein FlhB
MTKPKTSKKVRKEEKKTLQEKATEKTIAVAAIILVFLTTIIYAIKKWLGRTKESCADIWNKFSNSHWYEKIKTSLTIGGLLGAAYSVFFAVFLAVLVGPGMTFGIAWEILKLSMHLGLGFGIAVAAAHFVLEAIASLFLSPDYFFQKTNVFAEATVH